MDVGNLVSYVEFVREILLFFVMVGLGSERRLI